MSVLVSGCDRLGNTLGWKLARCAILLSHKGPFVCFLIRLALPYCPWCALYAYQCSFTSICFPWTKGMVWNVLLLVCDVNAQLCPLCLYVGQHDH